MPNLTGQSIGRYHILEQLGEGGMAIVYKAYDTRLERNVAFKVLRTDLFGQAVLEQVLKRFEREAKSLARLKHPNIVNILDFGEHEGMPYLVMEYLPGGTLKQKLGQVIPWQEAIQTLLPVARGLAYAHQHSVIHRDVKPANVLIDQNQEPILTDFGIAKLLEGADGHTLTASGVGIGTPEYMAPEQGIGASTIDARADIYSLGIVLYEMVTGRKPYIADTPMAVVLKQMTDPLPRPTDFVPDLPEEVEHILFKSLAKEPNDRYADMNALIAVMEGALTETKKSDVPVAEVVTSKKRVKEKTAPRAKPSSKVVMAVAGAVIFILVIAFGAPWVTKQSSLAPELEATSTKSLVTLLPPTETLEPPPSPLPEKNTNPTSTASTQSNEVIDFILNYISGNSPTFEDDFSAPDMVWGGTSEGLAIFPLVQNGVLTITDHLCEDCIGMGPDHFVPGTAFPINGLLDAKNFLLQFDFKFETGNPVNSVATQFRIFNFSIARGGTWSLYDNSGSQGKRIAGGNANPLSQNNTLLIAAYDDNLAVYLNNTLLYTSRDVSLTGKKNNIIVTGSPGSNMDFDNVKFWNLDEVKFSNLPGAFYEPILSYLAEGHTTFQDDFSTKAYLDTNDGVWDPTREGSIWAENGYRLVQKNDPSVEMTFPRLGQFNATDFALQYDAAFVRGTPLDGFGVYFRSSSDQKTNYKILFTRADKGWKLTRSDGTKVTELDKGSIAFDPYEFNTFSIIVKRRNLAVFANGDLIIQRHDIETSGIYNLFVATAQSDQRHLKIDNVKFWNLNGVDFK